MRRITVRTITMKITMLLRQLSQMFPLPKTKVQPVSLRGGRRRRRRRGEELLIKMMREFPFLSTYSHWTSIGSL